MTDDHKKNISESVSGKNHWNWQGGLTTDREYRSAWLKEWRHKRGISKKTYTKTTDPTDWGEYRKQWWANNKDRKTIYNNRRRSLKINAEGSHTVEEWQELKAYYKWTCLCCGQKEPDIILTEDHIIPLSRGGSNSIENIQPLCKICNSIKQTKVITYRED